MTETEWLKCNDPIAMMHYLGADPADRKTLLLVSACIRRHWDILAEAGREWVKLAEKYAEQPGPHRLPTPDIFGNDLDPLIFGDHWDGAISFAGEDRAAWDGVSGAIDQLWCAYYQCDDFDTLRGNAIWEAERREQAIVLRDVFGNPFHSVSNPKCHDGIVANAREIYEARQMPAGTLDNARLQNMAGDLEETGSTSGDILSHFREQGPHVRGCWALDLLLGRT
jgi:hypothetical protein